MNLQVIASPTGDILWVSGALPGSVHDKNAEWIWGVLAELEAAGLVTLADKGYQGSAHAKILYRGKNKPESQKEANRAHAQLRAPGERANAQLKNWRHPPQAPLLSLARRATRQGHPRTGDPRGITRMEKVQCHRDQVTSALTQVAAVFLVTQSCRAALKLRLNNHVKIAKKEILIERC